MTCKANGVFVVAGEFGARVWRGAHCSVNETACIFRIIVPIEVDW